MTTRIISWQQLVLEADPDWLRLSRQPWVYEFSNARRFYDPLSLYGPGTSPGPPSQTGDILMQDGTTFLDMETGERIEQEIF